MYITQSKKKKFRVKLLYKVIKSVMYQCALYLAGYTCYCSFDDRTHKANTAILIRNVLGVLDSNNHYDHSVIRRKYL